jgi:restriction system protein
MNVWMVRAGRTGEWEALAFEKNIAVVGWEEIPDLQNVESKDKIFQLCQSAYPDSPEMNLRMSAAQLWIFKAKIQIDDIVLLPLKTQRAIAIGRATGPYQFRSDLGIPVFHTRPVLWLRKDIPRTSFDQDLLHSLGALLTVCQIQRPNVEQRLRAFLGDKPLLERTEEPPAPLDVEQVAEDQILAFIQKKFSRHEFARLVDGILRAEGYKTRLSPPGPDGGVDVLAGLGPLGFDAPRLCVQVKSSPSPVDVNVLRELQGTMQTHQAEHGLLVSWGGFKDTVIRESRVSFFKVRLWDSGSVLEALLRNYHKLPEDLQTELPLKQIWALVQESD